MVELCLRGTVSRVSGSRFSDFEADQKKQARLAFNPMRPIAQGGLLKYVHGEGDDYRKDRRVMSPLAALCHMADVGSARILFDVK